MGDPVVIGGARTAIGRLLGSLAGFTAAELGGHAIKGALDRAQISPDQVEYVIMGHVLQAGASGARIALTLAYELRRRGGGLGAAGLCGGGGQGSALLIRVPR